jgi:invasion protein IalB
MFLPCHAFSTLGLTIGLLAAAFGATPALAQAAPAAPAAAPVDPNAPVLTEAFEDWTLRCFNVRGPAPCDILQVAVNKQNQQRVLSVSTAYVPERNAFAMQIAVPLGVALAKGMTLNAGDRTIKGAHYNRCNREGCYVEIIVDNETIAALSKLGASTMIVVYPYGRNTDAKLPLSLKGFPAAIARLKVVATQRAVRTTAAPGTAPAPATPAPAPATPPH